jgi:hypothetical protein
MARWRRLGSRLLDDPQVGSELLVTAPLILV